MPLTEYVGPNDEEILMAWDSMCADHGIDGEWAEAGPKALSIWADYLRLGAAVELWSRTQGVEAGVEEAAEWLGAERTPVPLDPIIGEIELRSSLLFRIMTTVSEILSDRRASLDLREDIMPFDEIRDRCLAALNETFDDDRIKQLWETDTLVSEYDD